MYCKGKTYNVFLGGNVTQTNVDVTPKLAERFRSPWESGFFRPIGLKEMFWSRKRIQSPKLSGFLQSCKQGNATSFQLFSVTKMFQWR